LSKQGSLGKIFIEAKNLPFKSCREAKNFFSKNSSTAKYLVHTAEDKFCECANSAKCNHLNKDKISSIDLIPKEEWLSEFKFYPKNVQNKLSNTFKNDYVKALRIALLYDSTKKSEVASPTKDYDLKESCTYYEVPVTSKKIKASEDNVLKALKRGYPLSSIGYTLKKQGYDNKIIVDTMKSTLKKIDTINEYQFNIPLPQPKTLKIITSQKDININMHKSRSELDVPKHVNSLDKPIENPVADLNIKSATLDIPEDKPLQEIEITGLNEFNID